MAYFLNMGKAQNSRSSLSLCVSDGMSDILNMHHVESLKNNNSNISVWRCLYDPCSMFWHMCKLFFPHSNILTIPLKTLKAIMR